MKQTIKVKNYRCFGYKPQTIELNNGFTAFVGINNSGKSAILKMFYELRPVWGFLSNPGHLSILGKTSEQHISGLLGISDCAEIFNHFTNGSIELEFSIKGTEHSFNFTLQILPSSNSQICIKVINESSIDGITTTFRDHLNSSGNTVSISYRQDKEAGYVESSVVINDISSFFKNLLDSIYIPAFRNIVNVSKNETHYDLLTGTAFVERWNEWKVGVNKFERDQITRITDDIKNLFGYKNLEINASNDKKTLRLIIEGKNYSLEEVGSGLSQFILTYASVAIRQPAYVFIDEPELNLHPALQLKFLASLATYAKDGVLFSTHSLGLARTSEKVFSVTSDSKESIISPFSKTLDYATLLGEMSFSAYSEIGVDSILFVEGPTDIKCMQEILRKYGKDTKVLIMSLGGGDMICGKREHELSEITTRIDVKRVYAWFDSEKKSDTEELCKDRADFLKICKKLKIISKATEKRATENYFTQSTLDKTYGPGKYTSLGDFDKRKVGSDWPKEDNWKLAREMDKSEIDATDLGAFIKAIK